MIFPAVPVAKMVPATSNAEVGVVLLIPTLLLTVSRVIGSKLDAGTDVKIDFQPVLPVPLSLIYAQVPDAPSGRK